MSKFDCRNYVVRVLKNEYEWLREVDKHALEKAVFNMDTAYQKFFKEHTGYPKFKSKKNRRKSYTTGIADKNAKNIDFSFSTNRVKLPKLKWIKAKGCREFTGKIKSATVSQAPSGKYFVSLLVETEHVPMKPADGQVGIDLGIKDLLITSNGEKIENPKHTKRYEKKLATEQRKLAHKQKGSANWEKQRIRVARVQEKIANTRKDYLHKASHKLIEENQLIVSEDLAVSNMVKNRNLSKAISDCGWYELTRQLQYKAEWNGRTYIKIGRYTKSSQPCNVCGYINPETKDLSVREWTCPMCESVHDRDVNAAINILHEGLRLLEVA